MVIDRNEDEPEIHEAKRVGQEDGASKANDPSTFRPDTNLEYPSSPSTWKTGAAVPDGRALE